MTERDRAVDEQQKFFFYLTGLTFGVLALSVQTASFDGPAVAGILELLAWALLLTSGVAGLLRLEMAPEFYRVSGIEADVRERRHELVKGSATGMREVYVTAKQQTVPVDTLIDQAKNDLLLTGDRLKMLGKVGVLWYRLQRYSFAGGILLLLIARGLGPALTLAERLRPVAS